MTAIPLRVAADNPEADEGWESRESLASRLNLRTRRDTKNVMRIENTADNAYRILEGHAKFSGIRYNALDHNVYDGNEVMQDPQLVGTLMQLQRHVDPGFRRHVLDEAISHLTINPARIWNPLTDWLNSLKWDGEPRMEFLFLNYFNCAPAPHVLTMPLAYLRSVAVNWMTMLVARAFNPGCKADNMLILEGQQGIGKSRALRILGGEHYRESKVQEVGSKDFLGNLRGAWIYDINELRSFRRSDSESIKAVLSGQEDTYRPPYGHTDRTFKRTCVIVGTTNKWEYLSDNTGGRRFWPVRCGPMIELELLAKYRDQLFAEAVERFKAGNSWWEMDEEMQKEIAAARTMVSPHLDIIQEMVKNPRTLPRLRLVSPDDFLHPEIWCYVSATLAFDAMGIAGGRRNTSMLIQLSDIFASLGFERYRARGVQLGRPEDEGKYTVFRLYLGREPEFGMTPEKPPERFKDET